MSKDIDLFGSQQANLPAHLTDAFGDGSNIDTGQKMNALSIRGKVFRIVLNGEENAIMKTNPETGDKEPVTVVKLIVLDQGPFGARSFYSKKYEPGTAEAPDCFSLDGEHPDPQADRPQSKSCKTCPHAVKGSKVSPNGSLTTACSIQRRLAVVPAHAPDFDPLLLRLAGSSAYDPDTKGAEDGWMAWRQYMDFLAARGVRHTAQLVTSVRFDSDAEHPKLLFKANRFIDADEVDVVKEQLNHPDLDKMLRPSEGPPPEPVAQPDPVPGEEEEEGEYEGEEEAAPPQKKKVSKKKASKKKTSRKAAEDDDDDGDELPQRNVVNEGKTKPAAGGDKDKVQSLLDDWDA